jgi:hypothetical protein
MSGMNEVVEEILHAAKWTFIILLVAIGVLLGVVAVLTVLLVT